MKKFLTLVFFSFVAISGYAQCAMCKAVVESNQAGDSLAKGLNIGIIYLMSVPYLLIAVLAILIYKHKQRQRVNTH
jgi:hypothetical protein